MTTSPSRTNYTLKEKLRDCALVWFALALLAALSVFSEMNRFYSMEDDPVVEVVVGSATKEKEAIENGLVGKTSPDAY